MHWTKMNHKKKKNNEAFYAFFKRIPRYFIKFKKKSRFTADFINDYCLCGLEKQQTRPRMIICTACLCIAHLRKET